MLNLLRASCTYGPDITCPVGTNDGELKDDLWGYVHCLGIDKFGSRFDLKKHCPEKPKDPPKIKDKKSTGLQ